MKRFIPAVLVLFIAASVGWADDRMVSGRVVDEAGSPVADAAVDYFWGANGTRKHADGTLLDIGKEEEQREFWGHVGEMEPRPTNEVRTGPDGSFTVKVSDISHVVMAMGPARQRGGLAVLPKGKEHLPIEIQLGPLVRVHGKLERAEDGQTPFWSHAYVLVPEDPTRPLNTRRLVSGGSFTGELEFLLPRGRYFLDVYAESSNREIIDLEITPEMEIDLTGDARDLDLGVLRLAPRGASLLQELIASAQTEQRWRDHTEHYGQPAPDWHVTDARGVDKDVQPADFRGKWVLVDFWGMSCPACLRRGLPNLMRFYEENESQRDKFEIVAFCTDIEDELKTVADLDRALEPIVKHAWDGKSLPFPVVLDTTFQTCARYGLRGFGKVVLIDPQGNLVEGDETTLAEILTK